MIAFADLLELLIWLFPSAGDDLVPKQIESSPQYDILSIRRRSTFLAQLEALRLRFSWQKSIRCQDAIEIVQRAQVTLEVDRVYGILGMIDPKIACRIPIEYDIQDHHEVWLRLAREAVMEDSTLSFLSRVSPKHHPTELPSWCPSFAPVQPSGEIYMHSGYSAGRSKQKETECQSHVIDNHRVSIRGFLIGVIITVLEVDDLNLLTFDLYLILVERQNYAELKGNDNEASERSLYANFSERLQYTYRWLQAAETLVRENLDSWEAGQELEDTMSRLLIRDWSTYRFVDWADRPSQYTRGDFAKARYPACSSVVEGYILVRSLVEDAAGLIDTDQDVLAHIISRHDQLSFRAQQLIELYLDSLAAMEQQSIFACSNAVFGMASGNLRVGYDACVLYGGEPIYILGYTDGGSRSLVGEGYARWCMELDKIPADVPYHDEVFVLG